jgi:hypothetical protein
MIILKMKSFILISIFVFIISQSAEINGQGHSDAKTAFFDSSPKDTLNENQILYNGINWRNLYYKIREDPFLFSSAFLPGSVTINGETFKNVSLRYDIYNDELMIPTQNKGFLQFNKESVDSFTLNFENTTYRFTNIRGDSINNKSGYFNVLYDGKASLFVKFKKNIELLAVEHKYDRFYPSQKIYLLISNRIYPVSGKRELKKLLVANEEQINNYIKKNKIKMSKKRPESFVPVIRFYDNLNQ